MRLASFFAGIGGFDLGFEQAGHDTVFQCEYDPFCTKILSRHWPNVPRIADIREITHETIIPDADVWCGGFPCQDVSLARARQRDGLRGARSGLFYKFAELTGLHRPPIVVIENVPGLLSSHGGRDFAIVLQTLAQFGYVLGWRVLNSQHFGVPQSRDRLYIVGCHRNPSRAAAILFESERSEGNTETGRQPKEKSVSPFKEELREPVSGAVVPRIGYCLAATSGRHTGTDWSRTYVTYPGAARRLTPEEAERLQGFPTGWTLPLEGQASEQFDSPRYHAAGNAVSVPVARWLGKRVSEVVQAEVVEDELRSSAKIAVFA